MAELSFKQIEEQLNTAFSEEGRKLIFWYDEKKEFVDEIGSLDIRNAKIHHLQPNNLFMTKVLLERRDKENNYLIYAPFKKPDNRENHLADIILYSREFFADRISLLAIELGLSPSNKSVLEKHISFFNSKARTRRFYDVEVDHYDSQENLETTLLSALVASKIASFDEVVRMVLTEDLRDNKYLEDFARHNLLDVFWKYCNLNFGYKDEEPSLIRLAISLLLTYARNQMGLDLAGNLSKYILNKPGTITAFVDQMMNSNVYMEGFRSLSSQVYKSIDGRDFFRTFEIENLMNLDVFKEVDEIIIGWVLERILDGSYNEKVNGLSLDHLCKNRKFKHFKDSYKDDYNVLINAYYLLSNKNIKLGQDISTIVADYDRNYYKMDSYYRRFYYYLDRSQRSFKELEDRVENLYIHGYLDKVGRDFNDNFSYEDLKGSYKLQKDFYKTYIAGKNERLVVIISDGFRYELGKELVNRFKYNEKLEAKIEPIIGVVPSYTRLGMAALLPHQELDLREDYSVLVDGRPSNTLKEREEILRQANPNSLAISYDDLVKLRVEDIRERMVGKELIYIYHNQIDNRAHHSEDEVFQACNESLDEIDFMIKRLTNAISTTRYIITADHGFIYTRRKNQEADKIDRFFEKDDMINKRFIISDNTYNIIGTKNMMVADALGNYDRRTVTLPLTSNVFKTQGGSQNYVHGGSSPQEVIIPLIEVRSTRGSVEVEKVKVSLVSIVSRINSFLINLDFFQQEAVSNTIKPASYKFRFENGDQQLISNEEIYLAKSKSEEAADRMFKLRFTLKNQKYDRGHKYYFVMTDTETGMDILRQEVIIDIAFADDFGFDL